MSRPASPADLHSRWSPTDRSPGPIYCPDPNVFRDGRRQGPWYSMTSRPKELSSDVTPGPAAYGWNDQTWERFPRESFGAQKWPTAPSYSFGVGHRMGRTPETCSPGPMYLPRYNGFGDGIREAYPFKPTKSRGGMFDMCTIPSPAVYDVSRVKVNKPSAPKYSISSTRWRYPDVFTVEVADETSETSDR